MLGLVTRLVGDRAPAPVETDAGDGPDARDDRPSSSLFECPDCESVYVATDLDSCRSCRTEVHRVASERDLGYGPAD